MEKYELLNRPEGGTGAVDEHNSDIQPKSIHVSPIPMKVSSFLSPIEPFMGSAISRMIVDHQ